MRKAAFIKSAYNAKVTQSCCVEDAEHYNVGKALVYNGEVVHAGCARVDAYMAFSGHFITCYYRVLFAIFAH